MKVSRWLATSYKLHATNKFAFMVLSLNNNWFNWHEKITSLFSGLISILLRSAPIIIRSRAQSMCLSMTSLALSFVAWIAAMLFFHWAREAKKADLRTSPCFADPRLRSLSCYGRPEEGQSLQKCLVLLNLIPVSGIETCLGYRWCPWDIVG